MRMRRAGSSSLILSVALLLAPPAHAAPAAAQRDTLEALRAVDVAVARVGHRLAVANRARCDLIRPATGLLLHGIEQYGGAYRTAAAQVFALGDAPGVAAVLPGSAAERAGVHTGDAIVAINDAATATTDISGGKGDFDRMARVLDQLEAALASGPVKLGITRGAERLSLRLGGEPACASRFQVLSAPGLSASADGQYVQVTSAMAAYFANEDEMAAILAHELAHNILRHRERLDAQGVARGLFGKFGKDAARVRETEIEADRLSLKLLADAGYRLQAAPEFWRRFGREHGFGIFSDATHLRWKPRVALLEAEIAALDKGQ